MALIAAWTGRAAGALQAALRLSNVSFANHLGIAARTVATWHEKPDLIPKTEMQQLLDTALERAPEAAQARFANLINATGSAAPIVGEQLVQAHSLQVAIAIVVNDSSVLLVQRRGEDGKGISWQFPAGVIKPGVPSRVVAVRETLAETGVHCAALQNLGTRIHPVTEVLCEYLLCEYLAGDAENRDQVENVSVAWAPTDRLTRFIPVEQIFPPVLEALEVRPA